MAIYIVWTYYIRSGKWNEYEKWLNSKEAQQMFDQLEKETGSKYLNTYEVEFGLGDYHCEDWQVAPDYAAFDKAKHSKAAKEWGSKREEFVDHTRSTKTRVMGAAREPK